MINKQRFPWYILCFIFLLMNMLSVFPEYEVLFTKIFFLGLSVALTFLALEYYKKDWFIVCMIEFCLYQLFDELTGRACKIDWWEILLAVGVLLFNYSIHKKWITWVRKYW